MSSNIRAKAVKDAADGNYQPPPSNTSSLEAIVNVILPVTCLASSGNDDKKTYDDAYNGAKEVVGGTYNSGNKPKK